LQWIAETREVRERVRRLEQEVVNAVEQEKQRISRDLHDEIGSKLTAIQLEPPLGLEGFPEKGRTARGRARRRTKIHRLLRETVREVRALSLELRPVYPDPFGLEGALKQLRRTGSLRQGRSNAITPAPVPDLQFQVFHRRQSPLHVVAQEAVADAIRSDARRCSRIEIEVRRESEISPADRHNGTGFEATAVSSIQTLGTPHHGTPRPRPGRERLVVLARARTAALK